MRITHYITTLLLAVLPWAAGCESFEDAQRRALGLDEQEKQVASKDEPAQQVLVRETPLEDDDKPAVKKGLSSEDLNLGMMPIEEDQDDAAEFENLDMEEMELEEMDLTTGYEGAGSLDELDGTGETEGDPLTTSEGYLSDKDGMGLNLEPGIASSDDSTEMYKQGAETVEPAGAGTAERGGRKGKPKSKQRSRRTESRTKPTTNKSSRLRRVAPTSEIRLSEGVTLPQVLPTGTAVGFAVRYQFVKGGPDRGAKYLWLIRSASGKAMARSVSLQGDGVLRSIVPEFRPQDAPFQTLIMEVYSNGQKRQIGKPMTFPTKLPR